MKALRWLALFCFCEFCIAARGGTNIIALSEWSKPVALQDQSLRGRLLILEGVEPAYGGPITNQAMTFVELQNVTGSTGTSVEFCFDVMKLNCQLTDQSGQAVPKPNSAAWSGRGPFSPCWVSLPYNSTIRLFVNGGFLNPLRVYPGGEPSLFWSIRPTDTNVYYLSGTLTLTTHKKGDELPEFYTATLEFPKAQIRPVKNVPAEPSGKK